MFDPVPDRFHVTEHHRRARLQSQLMRDLHHFQPRVRIAFQRRDPVADAIDQNFAAAAGDRAEAGLLELRDHLAQRHAEQIREVLQLRRAEPVNVDVRIFFADVPEQIEIPIE